MRFTLRNQNKIKEVFSETFLKELLGDLQTHFKNNQWIEKLDLGYKYPIIKVPKKNGGGHIFYVYSSRYDVLNLAYKETINID